MNCYVAIAIAIISASVLIPSVQAQSRSIEEDDGVIIVPRREDCIRNTSACISQRTRFKCAIMLRNLLPDPVFVSAIPDLIGQDTTPPAVMENLREKGVSFDDFHIADLCPERNRNSPLGKVQLVRKLRKALRRANARCYAMMDAYSKVGLDECEQSLVGDGKKSTSGDVLCQAAYHALKVRGAIEGNESWRADNIEIGMQVSYCGSSWRPVTTAGSGDSKVRLAVKEPLCCEAAAAPLGSGEQSVEEAIQRIWHRPCDGSTAAKKVCN